MADIKFEIVEHLGILSVGSRGWAKELNLVAWNNSSPKYDIREWDENHEHMGKGITLCESEFQNLKEILENV